MISHGAYGRVFEMCDPEGKCPYVLKVQFATPASIHEAKTQIYIHDKLKITPAVFDYWTCTDAIGQKLLYIVMDRMDGTLTDLLWTMANMSVLNLGAVEKITLDLRSLLSRLHRIKIAHLDLHESNVFFKFDTSNNTVEFLLGDWGQSQPLDRNTKNLDHVQLNLLMGRLWLLAYGRARITDLYKPKK